MNLSVLGNFFDLIENQIKKLIIPLEFNHAHSVLGRDRETLLEFRFKD